MARFCTTARRVGAYSVSPLTAACRRSRLEGARKRMTITSRNFFRTTANFCSTRRARRRVSMSALSEGRMRHGGSLTHNRLLTFRLDTCCLCARTRSSRSPSILVRAELAGNPTPIAEQIIVRDEKVAVSASAGGAIVYRAGPSIAPHKFVWHNRSGGPLETVAGSDFADSYHSSLSPDGTRLAASSRTEGTSDIWLLDMKRGVPSRLTSHPAFDLSPEWSPDGRRIAFTSNRRGPTEWALFMKAVDGSGDDEILVDLGLGITSPTDWSRDGRFILYT